MTVRHIAGEKVEDMTTDYSSRTSRNTGRNDAWAQSHEAEASSPRSAPNKVVLERSHWSKFLAGTAFAIPAQFNKR